MIINDLLRDAAIQMMPVPSHAELMKAMWEQLRPLWATRNQDGKMWAVFPGMEDVLFEQLWYGTEWVIEAEGVIVERVARK